MSDSSTPNTASSVDERSQLIKDRKKKEAATRTKRLPFRSQRVTPARAGVESTDSNDSGSKRTRLFKRRGSLDSAKERLVCNAWFLFVNV